MILPDRLRQREPYAIAAVGYLIYGLVYLIGAVIALTPERRVVFFGFVPWWAFYLAGLGLVVLLPAVVWQQYKWWTRLLALGPLGKALSLCWKQGLLLNAGQPSSLYSWVFLLVAIATTALLFRAGWGAHRSTAAH